MTLNAITYLINLEELMKLPIALGAALLSMSAFSTTTIFKGTIDVSKDEVNRNVGKYQGKLNVKVEVETQEPLRLLDATVIKEYHDPDYDISGDTEAYCATYMQFSPAIVKFTITDEAGK